MTPFNTIVGVVTLAGFALAIFIFVRERRHRKLLTFDVTGPLSLISILPDTSARKITLYYEETNHPAVKIKAAYLYYVRLANLGREPIRRPDLTDSDPLRIEVRHGRVLDCAVGNETRSVIGLSLGPLEQADNSTHSRLSFEFLDFEDGAIVRVLTESDSAAVHFREQLSECRRESDISTTQGVASTDA